MTSYKSLFGIGALVTSFAVGGCARSCDRVSAQGGFIGSSKAPYIVVKQSGGRITDVYRLENAIVQSETNSDGWLFLDQQGRPVFVGGDVKTIRLGSTTDALWNRYHDYHMEFETKTYEELYNTPSAQATPELNPSQQEPLILDSPLREQVQRLKSK